MENENQTTPEFFYDYDDQVTRMMLEREEKSGADC
jgi:hypothetical protein